MATDFSFQWKQRGGTPFVKRFSPSMIALSISALESLIFLFNLIWPSTVRVRQLDRWNFHILWTCCEIDLLLFLFWFPSYCYLPFLVSFLWKSHPYTSTGDSWLFRLLSLFAIQENCEVCENKRNEIFPSFSFSVSLKRSLHSAFHHNSYNLWSAKLWNTVKGVHH